MISNPMLGSSLVRVKRLLRYLYRTVDQYLYKVFMRNGFLASVYYALLSTRFYREHKAVLAGRYEYEKSLSGGSTNFVLLRRNIHRLEKGLIMRPRRQVFGADYILETVNCYEKAVSSEKICESEKQWAADVLYTYFDTVNDTPEIVRAKQIFKRCHSATPEKDCSSVPYPHSALPDPGVTYSALEQLFRRRRSVRWYKQQPVPDSLIKQAVNAAALAPSACNRQPYQFYVTNDPKLSASLASCAMGTAGYRDNIPCLVAVVGNLGAYPHERDRHVIYIDGSLASMQLMLALETLGLSTCPINWPDIEPNEKKLDKMLRLESHQRVILLLSVGYADPDGGVAYSQKKDDSSLVKKVEK